MAVPGAPKAPRASDAKGSILPLALVLLSLLALLSGRSMQAAVLELRMLANWQQNQELSLIASAAVDALVDEMDNFPLGVAEGYTLCGGTMIGDDCDGAAIGVATRLGSLPPGLRLGYQVQRLHTAWSSDLSVVSGVVGGSPLQSADLALFEVRAVAAPVALGSRPVTVLSRVARTLVVPAGTVPAQILQLYWSQSGVDEL